MLRTLLLVFTLFGQGPPAPKEEEAKLIVLLKSDKPLFDKAKACQRLAVIGTREAVPVLAGLLEREDLAHYARFALEPIPDPSVDDALRGAMGKLKGKLLVGAINSAGTRRDSKAIDALNKFLGGPDSEAAAAAASALGRIGTPEAIEILRRSLAGAGDALRLTVADACLTVAEALRGRNQRDAAVAIYEAVRRAQLPQHLQLAAARGAILTSPKTGIPVIIDMLGAGDWAEVGMALGLAREMPGAEVTSALIAQLPGLPAEKKTLVIQVLADRGDPAALPAVLEAARNESPQVRIAAFRALSRIGGARAVPVLLEAAAKAGAEVAAEALDSLAALSAKELDDAVMALDRADQPFRPVLIEIAGRRRIAAALPALRKAAEEEDERVRLAAIRALGQTIPLEDLPFLARRLVNPGSPGEATAALEALQAACGRIPDRDACAEKLLATMEGAPAEGKRRLLEVFIAVGGPKAVKLVSECAKDPNEEVRAAAIRALAEWRSEEAAPALLELAKTAVDEKERLRALRGFTHFIRRLGFAKERRLGFCQQAAAMARNDEERALAVEALAGIPAVETFPLLAPYYANPALREQACAASVAIGERILRFQPQPVADAMKQVLAATQDKALAERARKVFEQAGGKS